MLETEDYGKDLATVQNLNKKHQLIEADINAHQDRIRDLNDQADAFIESGVLDTNEIREKKESINDRYNKVRDHAQERRNKLNEANTLHQFFRDIDDEEAWIKEKKLLVGSDDYGPRSDRSAEPEKKTQTLGGRTGKPRARSSGKLCHMIQVKFKARN